MTFTLYDLDGDGMLSLGSGSGRGPVAQGQLGIIEQPSILLKPFEHASMFLVCVCVCVCLGPMRIPQVITDIHRHMVAADLLR